VMKDLTGQRFGKLTVIEFVGTRNKKAVFKCVCDCGNECEKTGTLLSTGKTRSCGCLAANNTDQTTHGFSKTHLYGVWSTMKSRCCNPKSQHYKNYGARGISVCDEWKNDFIAFRAWALENGYEEGLTLDRIQTNGNYEPSNCRWTTQKIQCNNKTNNRYIEFRGKTWTLHELADEYGIKYTTLWMRLNKYHWTIERALETP